MEIISRELVRNYLSGPTVWTLTTTAALVKLTWWTPPGRPSPSTGCWRTTRRSRPGRSTSTPGRWWSSSRSAVRAGGTSGWLATTLVRAGPPPPTWRSCRPSKPSQSDRQLSWVCCAGTGRWTGRSSTAASGLRAECYSALFTQNLIAPPREES